MAGPMMGRGHGGRGRDFSIKQKPKNLKETMKKLFKYIGYNKFLFISSIVFILLTTGLTLLAPVVQSNALGAITLDENNKINPEGFKFFLILLIIIYIFESVFSFFQNYISSRLSQQTVRMMRKDLFAKFTRLPIKFIDTHSHGDLMSRMTNDVENVSNTISQSISSLISGIVTIVGTLIIMIVKSWSLTLITLISTVLTILASSLLMKKMTPLFRRKSSELGELNGYAEEMITGYKTLVAYSKEEEVNKKFSELSTRLTKTTIKGEIWGGSMGPVMNGIGNLTYLVIAIVGSYIILKNPSLIDNEIAGSVKTERFCVSYLSGLASYKALCESNLNVLHYHTLLLSHDFFNALAAKLCNLFCGSECTKSLERSLNYVCGVG